MVGEVPQTSDLQTLLPRAASTRTGSKENKYCITRLDSYLYCNVDRQIGAILTQEALLTGQYRRSTEEYSAIGIAVNLLAKLQSLPLRPSPAQSVTPWSQTLALRQQPTSPTDHKATNQKSRCVMFVMKRGEGGILCSDLRRGR